MAVWQIMKTGEPTNAPLYDDAGAAMPGDPDFSTSAVAAYVQSLDAAADGFNYVGLSLLVAD